MTVERWTDEMLDKLAETTRENAEALRENADAIRDLRKETKVKEFRSPYYLLQFYQWVSVSLMATAIITTIVSAVYRR